MPHSKISENRRITIEYVSPTKLKEWELNPRVIGGEQYRALSKNVAKFGIVDPLIVDQHYRIVGGHQRTKVLRDLGLKAVPVVKLQLSRRDFKILNLALNKISGEWDMEKLAPLLEELAPLPELDLTGFSQQEANLAIESFPIQPESRDDSVPELPKGTVSKPGDLYKLGNHRLLCGDARDPNSWQILLQGRKAGMVFTDRPYGVRYDVGHKFVLDEVSGLAMHHKSWGKIKQDEDSTTAVNTLPNVFENMTEDGVAYICCGTKLAVKVANWLEANHVRYAPFLVWDKKFPVITWERYHAEHELIVYCGPGSYPTCAKGGIKSRWFCPKNETTVWRIPLEPNNQRMHPTQKPVAVYERAIINSSRRGEIVVDPFLGSGTCLIAAEKRHRSAYCIEIDPEYVDVAVKRWELFTHAQAERIDNFTHLHPKENRAPTG
ncbi:MAG: DNA modification methylase [Candidatus Bathyarchaeia archaeon]